MHKCDLIRFAVDHAGKDLSCAVIQTVILCGNGIIPTVHIGCVGAVKIADRVNDAFWFQGGCAVVKINQIRLIGKNRKILSDFFHIEHSSPIFLSISPASFSLSSSLSMTSVIGIR